MLKLNEQGAPESVKDLMLVIGASGFMDRGEIEAFRTTNPPETLPFAEVWIVTPFDETLPLAPGQ